MEMSRSCHFTIPGCHSLEPLDVFRVLRVAILKPTAAAAAVNDPSAASADDAYSATWPFTYETFVPELLRQRESANSLRERMERMRETFSKVVAFLRISGKYPSRLREKAPTQLSVYTEWANKTGAILLHSKYFNNLCVKIHENWSTSTVLRPYNAVI